MLSILEFLAVCFYFILPAYAANIAPILAKRFNIMPWLAVPVDCNANWGEKPLLGPHKTLRGFVLGTTAAITVTVGQTFLYPLFPFPALRLVNYDNINPFVLGFLLGLGSLLGDSFGSFIKRRVGKKPGEPLPILDQIGMAMMAIIAVVWVYPLSIDAILTIIVMTFFWHITAARAAYAFKIRPEKW